MKTCVILNPNAGSVNEEQELRSALHRLGDIQLRITQRPGHAKPLAQAALEDGCELVVAVGGDGTVNEVINGLAPNFSQVCFGAIPLGTGNDFVRSISIPQDVQAAVDVLVAGQTKVLDVVRVTSDGVRYFINVSSGGFSGLVNEKLTDEMKQSWGPLAYLRAAAEAVPDLTDYHTTIAFDEEDLQENKIYSLVVANARYVAGGIPIAPQARLDDGLLDVVIVPAASMPQLAILAPLILLGRHLDSELVTFRRARKVKVASRPGMWFNVDGELVGNEPATFEVVPRTLEVIVGPEIDTEA
jgi:diacylglycerol kinase (ATP)